MKPKIVLILLIVFSKLCMADCVQQNIGLFSNRDTVAKNSPLIINFYNYEGYLYKYPYLISIVLYNTDTMYSLKIKSSFKGYNQTQVLFNIPGGIKSGQFNVGILPSNDETAFRLKALQTFQSRYIPTKFGSVFLSDPITESESSCPLEINFKRAENVSYGCGPSKYAEYSLPKSEDDYPILEVTIINQNTKGVRRFYTTTWNGNLRIGHGMCYGEINVSMEENYSIKLRAYYPEKNKYCKIGETKLKTTYWH